MPPLVAVRSLLLPETVMLPLNVMLCALIDKLLRLMVSKRVIAPSVVLKVNAAGTVMDTFCALITEPAAPAFRAEPSWSVTFGAVMFPFRVRVFADTVKDDACKVAP